MCDVCLSFLQTAFEPKTQRKNRYARCRGLRCSEMLHPNTHDRSQKQ